MYPSRSARGTLCSNWPHAEREEYVLSVPFQSIGRLKHHVERPCGHAGTYLESQRVYRQGRRPRAWPASIRPTCSLGAEIGDLVEMTGKKTTVCKLLPAFKEQRGKGRTSDRRHHPRKCRRRPSAKPPWCAASRPRRPTKWCSTPLGYAPSSRDLEYIGSLLDGLPMVGRRPRARHACSATAAPIFR